MSGDIILMSGETGDTGAHVLEEIRLKLNLFLRFYVECLVELGFFYIKRFISVSVTLRGNLWNLLLHLHELKISELSLMISD